MDAKNWAMILGVASVFVIVMAFPLLPHWTWLVVFGTGVALAVASVVCRLANYERASQAAIMELVDASR